jgi:Concanavalin A-like lectin/glucanases superfamily
VSERHRGPPGTVTVAPTRPGLNTLYVRSYDRAGNLSPIGMYPFYVAAGAPPVGQWSLADGTGSVAADTGTGNQPGTIAGSPQWTAGRAQDGTALHLDGTGSVDTAGPVLDTTTSYSVAAWVHLTDTSDYRTVISQEGTVNSAFSLEYRPGSTWTLSFQKDASAAGQVAAWAQEPPRVGQWTHLVGVYDAAAGQGRLYVDGVAEGTVPWTTPWQATGPLHIGRVKWQGAPERPFAGDVADAGLAAGTDRRRDPRARDRRGDPASRPLPGHRRLVVPGERVSGQGDRRARHRQLQVVLVEHRPVVAGTRRKQPVHRDGCGAAQRFHGWRVGVGGVFFTTPWVAHYARFAVVTPTQGSDRTARIYELEVYSQ